MDDTTRERRLEKRRERYRRYGAKRRQTPEHKAKQREWHRAWRLKNRDRLLVEARAKHAGNPEKSRERSRRHNRKRREDADYKAKEREWQREWRKKNRAKIALLNRGWRTKNPDKYEAGWRRGEERKEAARVAIAGRPRPDACEICGSNIGGIVYDHCHRRGHFRGWICDRCNQVLGRVEDNAHLLVKMIAYLQRTAKVTVEQFPLPGI